MQAHQLKTKQKKSSRKRVGRGGKRGTYSGRGMKGQKSRSGFSQRATFEGGKAGIVAVTKKKRGFKSRRPKAQAVSLQMLNGKFSAKEEVTREELKQRGLVKKTSLPIKILAKGSLKKALVIKEGITVSINAKKAIEAVGGTVVAMSPAGEGKNRKKTASKEESLQ